MSSDDILNIANRYEFLLKDVKNVISHRQKKTSDKFKFPKWYLALRKKGQFTVKDNNLYFSGRRIIPTEKAEDHLREIVYDKNTPTPLGRDSLFKQLSKKILGVPRRRLAKWLNKQPFREIDVAPPEIKRSGVKVNDFGTFEFDLVEIKVKDLPKDLQEDYERNFYIFGGVEKLSNLVWYKIANTKQQKEITPILDECIKYFNKVLPSKLKRGVSDSGGEFSSAVLKKHGIKHIKVRLGPLIENKNRLIQKYLYKFLRSNQGNLKECLKKAVESVNRIENKNTKKTPLEAIKTPKSELVDKYNLTRQKGGKHKKPFEVGTIVRVANRAEKGVKKAFLKSYRPGRWSDGWKVIKRTRTGRYQVKKNGNVRNVTRDMMRIDHGLDKKSVALISAQQKNVSRMAAEARDKKQKKGTLLSSWLRKSKEGSAKIESKNIEKQSSVDKLSNKGSKNVHVKRLRDLVTRKPGRYVVKNYFNDEIILKVGKNKYRSLKEKHFFKITKKGQRKRIP